MSTLRERPRVFVGGTGRSGTTILARLLGCHRGLFSMPLETRFIVDPDGLADLVLMLSDHYDPFHAQLALERFDELMRVHLVSPATTPYPGYQLDVVFDRATYRAELDRFCSLLVLGTFTGRDLLARERDRHRRDPLAAFHRRLGAHRRRRREQPRAVVRRELRVVRHFEDRTLVVGEAASFVDALFGSTAARHGKPGWCEKTPFNLLHLPFLWELFPDAGFVHMVRDPRAVVHSLSSQFWAPSDVKLASQFLAGVYGRWFEIRRALDLGQHRYVEIRLEDLASAPQDTLRRLCSTLELDDDFDHPPVVSAERVGQWEHAMGHEARRVVEGCLGQYMEALGYP